MEAGLDSLGAVELTACLVDTFQLQLPATALFDHPTIAALAQYITTQLVPPRVPSGECGLRACACSDTASHADFEFTEARQG